jgi:hypothetical protein
MKEHPNNSKNKLGKKVPNDAEKTNWGQLQGCEGGCR